MVHCTNGGFVIIADCTRRVTSRLMLVINFMFVLISTIMMNYCCQVSFDDNRIMVDDDINPLMHFI